MFLNDDLPEQISRRIQTNITASLWYACRFWAAHLHDTMADQCGLDSLMKEVKEFLLCRLLFWLEVMSLKQEVSVVNMILLTVVPWIHVSICSDGVELEAYCVNLDIADTRCRSISLCSRCQSISCHILALQFQKAHLTFTYQHLHWHLQNLQLQGSTSHNLQTPCLLLAQMVSTGHT